MPALPNQSIRRTMEDGQLFYERVRASVDTSGMFHVEIPAALLKSHSHLYGERNRWKDIDPHCPRNIGEIGTTVKKGVQYVSGHTLKDCISYLEVCAIDSLTSLRSVARVILYRVEINAEFAADAKGNVAPNATKSGFEWWRVKLRQRHRFTNEAFSTLGVGVAAKVYDKITYAKASGADVQWQLVKAGHGDYDNHSELDPEIVELNSFLSIGIDPERATSPYEEMPYTPEAAAFFVKMMLGMCKIAKTLDEFFGDKERLQLAIAQGTPLLEN